MHKIWRVIALQLAMFSAGFSQDVPVQQKLQLNSDPPVVPRVSLSATRIDQDGPVIHLKGNVEIRRIGLILRADEADYRKDTGEIEVKGNVRVAPFPRTMAQIRRDKSK